MGRRTFKTQLMSQNAEQAFGGPQIPALVLQILHLLDRNTKPLG